MTWFSSSPYVVATEELWFNQYPYSLGVTPKWLSQLGYSVSEAPAGSRAVGTGFSGRAIDSDSYSFQISSFQLFWNSGRVSTLSMIVPDGLTHFDGIEAKKDGDLVIDKFVISENHVKSNEVEFVRFEFDSFSFSSGGKSNSINVRGSKTIEFNSPASLDIGDEYMSSSRNLEGEWSVTIPPFVNVRPNDSLTFGSTTITVDSVTFVSSKYSSTQTITGS